MKWLTGVAVVSPCTVESASPRSCRHPENAHLLPWLSLALAGLPVPAKQLTERLFSITSPLWNELTLICLKALSQGAPLCRIEICWMELSLLRMGLWICRVEFVAWGFEFFGWSICRIEQSMRDVEVSAQVLVATPRFRSRKPSSCWTDGALNLTDRGFEHVG